MTVTRSHMNLPRSALVAWGGSLALALATAPARAALITETVNGMPIVLDTSNNVQWLDAADTLGMSPSTALATFPGYSLATVKQVDSLWESMGMLASNLPTTGDSSFTYDDSSYTPGQTFGSTMGLTYFKYAVFAAPSWEQQGWGNYLDDEGTGWNQISIDARNPLHLGSAGTDLVFNPLLNPLSTAVSGDFDMLVESVPEPTSALLVLSGLFALAIRRRR
jgi:hypothetical protein